MKKYLVGILCVGLISLIGCTTIGYSTTAENGDKSTIRYKRIGKQSINDCQVKKLADGSLEVSFSGQAGGEKIVDIMANLAETVKSMAGKSVIPTP